MQKAFWFYLFLIFTGFILLELPENGKRLITINKYHGPSAMDVYGLAFILVSWVGMLITTLVRYRKVKALLNVRWRIVSYVIIVLGSAWIITTLLQNTDKGWRPGAVISTTGYMILFAAAFKK